MKKLAIVFMMFGLFLTSCGPAKTTKGESGETKVAVGDAGKALLGKWEGVELGDVLAGFGFATPATWEFTADRYVWNVVIGGTNVEYTGTYKVVDASSDPYKIDFQQETKAGKPNNEVSTGIFGFTKEGNLKIILYRKAFLPRPSEFGDDDTAIYKKAK